MRRLAISSGLSVALVLAGLVAAGAAMPPPPPVTTTFTFVDPPAPTYQFNSGQLKATFRATSAGGGNWNVDATFKPHSLDHMFWIFGYLLPTEYWIHVHNTASVSVVAAPGQAVAVVANGLAGSGNVNIWADCTFTVGTNGVVTVQEIMVAGNLGGIQGGG